MVGEKASKVTAERGQCLHFGTPEKHVNPLAMLDAMEGTSKGLKLIHAWLEDTSEML